MEDKIYETYLIMYMNAAFTLPDAARVVIVDSFRGATLAQRAAGALGVRDALNDNPLFTRTELEGIVAKLTTKP